jgi:hypothetical protein
MVQPLFHLKTVESSVATCQSRSSSELRRPYSTQRCYSGSGYSTEECDFRLRMAGSHGEVTVTCCAIHCYPVSLSLNAPAPHESPHELWTSGGWGRVGVLRLISPVRRAIENTGPGPRGPLPGAGTRQASSEPAKQRLPLHLFVSA